MSQQTSQAIKVNKKSGMILLMVLVLLSALAILVVNLIEIVQVERQISVDELNKVRSRLLARSGVEFTMAVYSDVDLSKKTLIFLRSLVFAVVHHAVQLDRILVHICSLKNPLLNLPSEFAETLV